MDTNGLVGLVGGSPLQYLKGSQAAGGAPHAQRPSCLKMVTAATAKVAPVAQQEASAPARGATLRCSRI